MKDNILCCIYTYSHGENSELWLNRLRKEGFDAVILDNGSNKFSNKNEKYVKHYDNIYYGGLYVESVKMVKEKQAKYLFFVCDDILIDEENFAKLVFELETIDSFRGIGIYQPSTTDESHNVWPNNINRGTGGIRYTNNVEGWMGLVRSDILMEMEKLNIDFATEMQKGWGIDILLSWTSLRMGYKNVVDDGIIVTHPKTESGYNGDEAKEEMNAAFDKIGKSYNSLVLQCYNMVKKSPNLICCLLNYKHDANSSRWFNILNQYYDTWVIDTFHKEDNSTFQGDVPYTRIVYLNNVYWGGSYMEAYKILCNHSGAKYLMTVDTDIEITDDNAEKMIKALDIFKNYDRIGVYTGTLRLGSKALGSTTVNITNCHLYNHGTGKLRDVHGIEGWLNIFKKDVMDDIFPHLKLPDNKYGWGIPPACIRRAIKRGLRVVADDRYQVFHPESVSYNNIEAQEEENRFKRRYIELHCLLPEEEQEIYEKLKI